MQPDCDQLDDNKSSPENVTNPKFDSACATAASLSVVSQLMCVCVYVLHLRTAYPEEQVKHQVIIRHSADVCGF